jgi:hypothetical protein
MAHTIPEDPHDGADDMLERTETCESLRIRGVSENPPPLDVNYLVFGREAEPVFPEEYVIETNTGLVPERTLEQIRSPYFGGHHKESIQRTANSF